MIFGSSFPLLHHYLLFLSWSPDQRDLHNAGLETSGILSRPKRSGLVRKLTGAVVYFMKHKNKGSGGETHYFEHSHLSPSPHHQHQTSRLRNKHIRNTIHHSPKRKGQMLKNDMRPRMQEYFIHESASPCPPSQRNGQQFPDGFRCKGMQMRMVWRRLITVNTKTVS